MISKGPYITEDWLNGCWKLNFAIIRIHYILKYIKLETVILICNNIVYYYNFYCIFYLKKM